MNPSLYLGQVSSLFTRHDIYCIVDRLQWGRIQSIELIPCHTTSNKVFVHFYYWIDQKVKEQIVKGKCINIVYNYHYDGSNNPWVWKACLASSDGASNVLTSSLSKAETKAETKVETNSLRIQIPPCVPMELHSSPSDDDMEPSGDLENEQEYVYDWNRGVMMKV